MSNTIKEKLSRIRNNPLKKIFQDKVYEQDLDSRKSQILFYKLLMILAYSDGSIDESEIDLIKDHFYEDCLTEAEWREISFYQIHKPSKEEIKSILDNILIQIKSNKEKEKFKNALLEIVNADSVFKNEEQEIISYVMNEIDSSGVSTLKNFVKKMISEVKKNKSIIKEDSSAKEYAANPVYPILQNKKPDLDHENLSVISAKLGLFLVIIYSDMNFDEKEKNLFKELVKRECNFDGELLNDFLSKIFEIPEEHFEIVYLCRVLTDYLNEEERINVLKDLFKIARANKIYDSYEEKDLRIIASSLFIDHSTFIKVKCS
ncbi:MAG: TerB family tellurite resistance protein [Spirochaetes bacterium]|nr:TerB family tellurite resistance protein [Spirochaetota bacterium]